MTQSHSRVGVDIQRANMYNSGKSRLGWFVSAAAAPASVAAWLDVETAVSQHIKSSLQATGFWQTANSHSSGYRDAVGSWPSAVGASAATVAGNTTLRRGILATAVLILAVSAYLRQIQGLSVEASAALSAGLFAALLTGEAVVFALSFSPASTWPSLQDIDAHTGFRDWIILGAIGAGMVSIGLLNADSFLSIYGASLLILADLFGVISFMALFTAASAVGRRRMLSRLLTQRLEAAPSLASRVPDWLENDGTVSNYVREVDRSVAQGDSAAIHDLVEQLVTARAADSPFRSADALEIGIISRVAKGAIGGTVDGAVARAAMLDLVQSQLADVNDLTRWPADAALDRTAGLGQTSRFLACLSNACLILVQRDAISKSAAREIIAATLDSRSLILRAVDPDPPWAAADEDLLSPLTTMPSLLAWTKCFVEYHGSAQAAALYPVYSLITRRKFNGNYWDGASILDQLRTSVACAPPEESRTESDQRIAFRDVGEFDRIWTGISVGALATMRDANAKHPAELAMPEFSDDQRLLAAYLRTFATHRYFSDAEGALKALAVQIASPSSMGTDWALAEAALLRTNYVPIPPESDIYRRLSATVLAIAMRIAPLEPEDSNRELSRFLNALPSTITHAVGNLACRIMPGCSDVHAHPASHTIERLTVLQDIRSTVLRA